MSSFANTLTQIYFFLFFHIHPHTHTHTHPCSPKVILGVTNPFFTKTLDHWPHVIKLGDISSSSSGVSTFYPLLLSSLFILVLISIVLDFLLAVCIYTQCVFLSVSSPLPTPSLSPLSLSLSLSIPLPQGQRRADLTRGAGHQVISLTPDLV